ncbi:MAG: hypothetical protein ACOC0U_03045, partial [Desulfovibrionales bacterium]
MLLIYLSPIFPAFAADNLLYQEKTGDEKIVYSWSLERGLETVTITVDKQNDRFLNQCRENGETVAWSQNGSDSKVNAFQNKGRLHVSGTFKGKQIKKEVDLKGLPWIQPLSYSLPRLVRDGEEHVLFWILRPDTLEPVKLKAEFKALTHQKKPKEE